MLYYNETANHQNQAFITVRRVYSWSICTNLNSFLMATSQFELRYIYCGSKWTNLSQGKTRGWKIKTTVALSLNSIRMFSESAGPLKDALPITFDTTEDNTINNLTRADVNCDKTGTCYDGKMNLYWEFSSQYII